MRNDISWVRECIGHEANLVRLLTLKRQNSKRVWANPDPFAVQLQFSTRELLALGSVLQLRTCRDLDALGGGNLDGLAGARVTARTRCTGGLLE